MLLLVRRGANLAKIRALLETRVIPRRTLATFACSSRVRAAIINACVMHTGGRLLPIRSRAMHALIHATAPMIHATAELIPITNVCLCSMERVHVAASYANVVLTTTSVPQMASLVSDVGLLADPLTHALQLVTQETLAPKSLQVYVRNISANAKVEDGCPLSEIFIVNVALIRAKPPIPARRMVVPATDASQCLIPVASTHAFAVALDGPPHLVPNRASNALMLAQTIHVEAVRTLQTNVSQRTTLAATLLAVVTSVDVVAGASRQMWTLPRACDATLPVTPETIALRWATLTMCASPRMTALAAISDVVAIPRGGRWQMTASAASAARTRARTGTLAQPILPGTPASKHLGLAVSLRANAMLQDGWLLSGLAHVNVAPLGLTPVPPIHARPREVRITSAYPPRKGLAPPSVSAIGVSAISRAGRCQAQPAPACFAEMLARLTLATAERIQETFASVIQMTAVSIYANVVLRASSPFKARRVVQLVTMCVLAIHAQILVIQATNASPMPMYVDSTLAAAKL